MKLRHHPSTANDPLFPGAGGATITAATGIPYVAIAEFSYGISDRFAIGAMAGTTPVVPGYGLRIRGVLYQNDDNFRIYARVPIFYYPQTKDLGGEPWLLAWPIAAAEWRNNSGTRLSVNAGVVTAVCAESLFGIEKTGMGFNGGVWNTVGSGISVPLDTRTTVQAEASLVLSGLKIAGSDWVGGPPAIVILGVSRQLGSTVDSATPPPLALGN